MSDEDNKYFGKLVIAVIVILILAGIGVGIYFLVTGFSKHDNNSDGSGGSGGHTTYQFSLPKFSSSGGRSGRSSGGRK
jgi:hypothetical protein